MEKTWQSEAFFSHLPDTLQNFSQLGWIYCANCKSNQLSINIQWKNVLVVIPRGCNCIAIFHDLLDISTFINWWKLWLYLIISPKKHRHHVLGIYFSISIVLKPDRYFEFDPWVYKLYMYAKIGMYLNFPLKLRSTTTTFKYPQGEFWGTFGTNRTIRLALSSYFLPELLLPLALFLI